jgi:SAM-dependent methyltransferase
MVAGAAGVASWAIRGPQQAVGTTGETALGLPIATDAGDRFTLCEGGRVMHPSNRPCPLLERSAPSDRVDHAPPPWELQRCRETGFVYLANPPAQDRFREEFAWEVTHAHESQRRRTAEPALYALSGAIKTLRQRFLKRDKMAALVRSTLRGAARHQATGPIRLVDVGCAQGTLATRVAGRLPRGVANRIEPIGIEISTYLAKVAHLALRAHNGRCIHGTGIDGLADLDGGSVHVIVLSCILEHEIDPLPLLRRCRERLAADGRVVIKVPNYDCMGRHLRGPRWCGYRWPDHVNYFTPATLEAIGRAAGLRVTRMNLFDRSPLSDSLYAVFGRDEAVFGRDEAAACRSAVAATPASSQAA